MAIPYCACIKIYARFASLEVQTHITTKITFNGNINSQIETLRSLLINLFGVQDWVKFWVGIHFNGVSSLLIEMYDISFCVILEANKLCWKLFIFSTLLFFVRAHVNYVSKVIYAIVYVGPLVGWRWRASMKINSTALTNELNYTVLVLILYRVAQN